MPKLKPKRGQQSQGPKQKLKQDDRTAQREQQQLFEMKQKDAEIAQLKQELTETKQRKDDDSAQFRQELADLKLKMWEEQETKSRRCEEQTEKPVGEDQTGVPSIHSSEPVAGGRGQPQEQSYKCALLGKHEKEFMYLPLKKHHESFEHSKKNLMPPAELPRLPVDGDPTQPVDGDPTQPVDGDPTQPVGEDQAGGFQIQFGSFGEKTEPVNSIEQSIATNQKQRRPVDGDPTQPVGEDPTRPECEDQAGGFQIQFGSLNEKTEDLSWFEQSDTTNFEIEVEIPERTNTSEHENEIMEKVLGDRNALHKMNLIEKIPCATPAFEGKVQRESEFLLRELPKAGKAVLNRIDNKIVTKLRERFIDKPFVNHNGKRVKLQHPIHKRDFRTTVRIISVLKLTKPSQSDFDLDYRVKHNFPELDSHEYDFYSKILGGDGDTWLKVLEETAKKVGVLGWQYFKLIELIAQVNHEVHPVINPEKLIADVKQHGFICRGVDFGDIVECMAKSLMAKK